MPHNHLCHVLLEHTTLMLIKLVVLIVLLVSCARSQIKVPANVSRDTGLPHDRQTVVNAMQDSFAQVKILLKRLVNCIIPTLMIFTDTMYIRNLFIGWLYSLFGMSCWKLLPSTKFTSNCVPCWLVHHTRKFNRMRAMPCRFYVSDPIICSH